MKILTLILLLATSFSVNSQIDGLDSLLRQLKWEQIDREMEYFEKERDRRRQRNELPPINTPILSTCDLYYINNRFSYLGERYDLIRAKDWQGINFGKEPLIIYFEQKFFDDNVKSKNISQIIRSSSVEIRKSCPGLSKKIFD